MLLLALCIQEVKKWKKKKKKGNYATHRLSEVFWLVCQLELVSVNHSLIALEKEDIFVDQKVITCVYIFLKKEVNYSNSWEIIYNENILYNLIMTNFFFIQLNKIIY